MNNNVIEPTAVEGVGTEYQESDITINPVYTFRKLNSTDAFLMFKIIGKIGINEFNECFSKDSVKQMVNTVTGDDSADGSVATVGLAVLLEAANVVIGNLPQCEQEIYQMLSNTSNLSVKQVKELDFAVFFQMVIDFIKKEEFRDFIGVVSKLFK